MIKSFIMLGSFSMRKGAVYVHKKKSTQEQSLEQI